MKTGPPPTHVLVAFAVAEAPMNLPGGHGHVWATQTVVLKLVDDDTQAAWDGRPRDASRTARISPCATDPGVRRSVGRGWLVRVDARAWRAQHYEVA